MTGVNCFCSRAFFLNSERGVDNLWNRTLKRHLTKNLKHLH